MCTVVQMKKLRLPRPGYCEAKLEQGRQGEKKPSSLEVVSRFQIFLRNSRVVINQVDSLFIILDGKALLLLYLASSENVASYRDI